MNWFVWTFIAMIVVALLMSISYRRKTAYRGRHRGPRTPLTADDIRALFWRRGPMWE